MGSPAGSMEEGDLSEMKNPKPRIPIARPDLTEMERDYVDRVMRSGWITQGYAVEEAQERLKVITGRKYALCTSSGTSALIAALLAVRTNVVPWVVAAPVLTFAAVSNAISLTGGRLFPLGADEKTWQVPEEEGRGCTFNAAIMAPCYGKVFAGSMVRYATEIMIEDAAESFGGTFEGRQAGSLGDISCISFYANKICTAAEGGAVLTDDPDLFAKLKALINHGIDNPNYEPRYPGFNGRMTDLQAAILCAQLERMPYMLERRRKIMAEYVAAAAGEWKLPEILPGEVCAPWLFAGLPLHGPDYVRRRCREENIECRPFFFVPFIAKAKASIYAAKRLSLMGMCLPLSSAMTDIEVERVCKVIRGK